MLMAPDLRARRARLAFGLGVLAGGLACAGLTALALPRSALGNRGARFAAGPVLLRDAVSGRNGRRVTGPSLEMAGRPAQKPPVGVPAKKLLSNVVGGIAAAGLVLAPAVDVLGPAHLSHGSVAYAQGATSAKSTRGAPTKDANKDPESILRLSLPINEKNPIREAQDQLEMKMDKVLREVKADKWGKAMDLNKKAQNVVAKKSQDILKDVRADSKDEAEKLLGEIKDGLGGLEKVIEGEENKAIKLKKREVLKKIGDLEQLMVQKFPYAVPAEYADLPQLKGRATVKLVLKKPTEGAMFEVIKGEGVKAETTEIDRIRLNLVIDGYSAPVAGGNFVDLVNKGFYNGLTITRSDGFIIQSGDPNPDQPKAAHGYSVGGKERTVPLEVFAEEDKAPTYGVSFEDDGRPLAQPRLPVSVYGTVAMAHTEDDVDSGSSQWFFVLFDPELVTAGRNLIDGRYTSLGYATEGNLLLSGVQEGDVIESATVVSGLENLKQPGK